MVGAKKRKIIPAIFVILILFFFYFPIITLMVFSFNDSRSLMTWAGFSLRWYEQLFRNREMMQAVYTTISIATIATIVSTFIGTITAIGLSKSRRIVKELVLNINDLPIMNPEIVTAIGLMLLFTSMGIKKGYLTMLLAHIAFCIPYVILSVLPKMRNLDPNLAEAALDLGATPWYALWKVIVPQIMPGVVSGALIAFTMSFDDFVISYFVTGNGVKNISILVYTMSKRINPTINALSTIIVAVVTLVLIMINVVPAFVKRKDKKGVQHS